MLKCVVSFKSLCVVLAIGVACLCCSCSSQQDKLLADDQFPLSRPVTLEGLGGLVHLTSADRAAWPDLIDRVNQGEDISEDPASDNLEAKRFMLVTSLTYASNIVADSLILSADPMNADQVASFKAEVERLSGLPVTDEWDFGDSYDMAIGTTDNSELPRRRLAQAGLAVLDGMHEKLRYMQCNFYYEPVGN